MTMRIQAQPILPVGRACGQAAMLKVVLTKTKIYFVHFDLLWGVSDGFCRIRGIARAILSQLY